MNAIEETISQLKNISRSIDSIVKEEIKKQSGLIERLNRSQLATGIDAQGNPTPKYVPGSRQPMAPGNIKFKDTGDFYADIEAKFEAAGFTTESSKYFLDPYKGIVETLGLNDESAIKLMNVVLPKVLRRLI